MNTGGRSMPVLKTKDLPEDLYEQLKTRRQDLLSRLIEEYPVLTGEYPSPAELIREDRDR